MKVGDYVQVIGFAHEDCVPSNPFKIGDIGQISVNNSSYSYAVSTLNGQDFWFFDEPYVKFITKEEVDLLKL
jgi:hypothetical protein